MELETYMILKKIQYCAYEVGYQILEGVMELRNSELISLMVNSSLFVRFPESPGDAYVC